MVHGAWNSLPASATAGKTVLELIMHKVPEVIANKTRNPINGNNRKIIVFTAFADTAEYLYEELAPWAQRELGLHSAMVIGGGKNRSTLPNLRKDFSSIISAFSPRSTPILSWRSTSTWNSA